MRKDQIDKMADDLLRRHEKVDKYKNMTPKASGLASFLTQKPEEEILKEDLKYTTIPNLLAKLHSLKQFYDAKTYYNDNSRVLKNEINFSLKCLDDIENHVSLEELKEMKEKFTLMESKYGMR